MSDITRQEALTKIGAMIKDVKFAMLTVQSENGHLKAHPMTTQDVEFDGDLWFLGGKDTEQVRNMAARPQVNVSYSKPDKGIYVSLQGTATLVEDRAKLDELWNEMYKAYFPEGKDDPNIQLIRIEAHGAEYWESDGKIRSLLGLAKGLLTGTQAKQGENERVSL
ncbi:pyridoxamine 5'-phosphate oxidase family protein [Deinococcus multiflagellatus]|uniref:Pyridoxamine 5'-phosphate oxidase family protein n=1 Tax=Deinococcus multiflagellatus TaxID=1656887 RepID=A0ABW1ZI85_9DEIO|nr:pyridoxamine 5'-phosphate oxidase family protein [Deinococcus multiflagellatus]MBZ9711795.1 pyridoxamine 5'-phosphate oxidase family protein [Deinococcus multiflagellatus]